MSASADALTTATEFATIVIPLYTLAFFVHNQVI
jgi:hypothetical protein